MFDDRGCRHPAKTNLTINQLMRMTMTVMRVMKMKMRMDDDRELLVRADLTTNQFSCSVANAWVAFNSGTCLHQHFNFQQTIWLKTFNFQQTTQFQKNSVESFHFPANNLVENFQLCAISFENLQSRAEQKKRKTEQNRP